MAKDPAFKGVDLWFTEWLDAFLTIHNRTWWPKAGTEEYTTKFGSWKKAFRRNGLHDKDIAIEIIELMDESPPEHDSDFLPSILKHARKIYGERSVEAKGDIDNTIEGIRQASLDCLYCEGRGFATVWHPRPHDVREGYQEYSTSAWCLCKYGLWQQGYYRTKNVEGMGKLPSVAAILEKKSGWLLSKPGCENLPTWQGWRNHGAFVQALANRMAKKLDPRAQPPAREPAKTQAKFAALPKDNSTAY